MNDQYQLLITQYFDKTISDEGLTQLRDWLEQDTTHQRKFRDTLKILEESRHWFKEPESRDRVWNEIENRIIQQKADALTAVPRRFHRVYLFVAASVLLALTVAGIWFGQLNTDHPLTVEYVTYHNSRGKRSKLTLPDSSIVHLNAESSVRFMKHFGKDIREIELNGEAFFEVVPDKTRPFVVSSNSVKTTVLGTRFNVKAFAQEQRVAVTVEAGKVGVSMAEKGAQKFLQYLLPGQQLDINTATGDYAFNSLKPDNASAWKDSKLAFDNQSLKEIVLVLSRWYNVDVVLTHPERTASRYTVKFDNMPLNQVMDIMTELTGCRYTFRHNNLIINNKNCR